ncbi:ABC transporter permease [Paenibacillus sp. J5C_2022]|uniref:ABC transporter permease n=1 Tax=Paenibacillus sp. J5C2022 TaxID=2977129 RepID=UPI0021D01704|nr:ABC transporter permease [Paenibacillus sp. J5C2022]MCU6707532.1 ABC transporter permease [Paenibacillus sp. J5C2022]
MRRIQALSLRIIRQFLRDKRTLALLIMAPLLLLSLMYLVFNGDTPVPKLGIVKLPSAIEQSLSKQEADMTRYDSETDADTALAAGEIDAYLHIHDNVPTIRLEGSDPVRNRAVIMLVSGALQQIAAGEHGMDGGFTPVFEYLHGSSDMSSFDSMGPVLIGLFAFFFVFLIAGVSFLKERTSGTLERLLATPLRRWEIVAGYIAGFGLFTGAQAVLVAIYSIEGLGLMMEGSIWLVLLITLLLSITALSLGTFLSAFANTEFQMIQFIPIVIVPQVFFSGLFDLEAMSPWLRWVAYLMPLKYGADALRSVMIRGEGWQAIAGDIAVLAALSLFFMAANVLALRKHRKI